MYIETERKIGKDIHRYRERKIEKDIHRYIEE